MIGKTNAPGRAIFQQRPVCLHRALRIVGQGGVYMGVYQRKTIHLLALLIQRVQQRLHFRAGTDGDAKIAGDAWLVKVPYQHLACSQLGKEPLSIPVWRAGEYEIGLRGKYGKAAIAQFLAKPSAGGLYFFAARLGIRSVLDGCLGAGLGKLVNGIAVKAVFYAGQGMDQLPVSQRIADAKPCQRVRFAQRAHDQKVFIPPDERSCALRAKGNICFIDQNQALWVSM